MHQMSEFVHLLVVDSACDPSQTLLDTATKLPSCAQGLSRRISANSATVARKLKFRGCRFKCPVQLLL